MQTTPCPICDSDVIIADEMNEGDLAACATCGAELEIISLHPIQLKNLEESTDGETAEKEEFDDEEDEEEDEEEKDE